MIDLIVNNPYRILGVFVNSSLKERLSNINKFKAYDKVGKSIDTEVDFSIVLGDNIPRTLEDIENANQELNLAIDQVRHAMFWFSSSTQADVISLKHLEDGNIGKAISIVEKFSSWSSLLNYHTLSLIKGDLKGALSTIIKLIKFNDSQFQTSLGCENLNLSKDKLFLEYYDLLSKVHDPKDILDIISHILDAEDPLYKIVYNSVIDNYITQLIPLIENAKSVEDNGADANLNAGLLLMTKASPILLELKHVASDHTGYEFIADKIALQVLRNGIEYYNNTYNKEAPRIALPLFEFAKRTAVGQLAKDRCDKNYSIVKIAFDKLPPEEIIDDLNKIESLVDAFDDNSSSVKDSKVLVLQTIPFLGNIKEHGALNHPATLYLSTTIIRKAFNSIISEVNNAFRSYNLAHNKENESKLIRILIQSWDVTLYLNKFPILEDSKDWYFKNRDQLKEFMLKFGLSTADIYGFSIKTEPELFQACKSLVDYQNYLSYYPNGRYSQIAKQRINKIKQEEELEKQRLKEKRAKLIKSIQAAQSLAELWRLESKCYDENVITLFDEKAWKLCKERTDYIDYLKHLPNGKYKNKALKKSKTLGQRLYNFYDQKKLWFNIIILIVSVMIVIGTFWGLETFQSALYVLSVLGFATGFISLIFIGFNVKKEEIYLALIAIGFSMAFLALVWATNLNYKIEEINNNKHQELLAQNEPSAYNKFINNPTEENFKEYVNNYEQGKYITEVVNTYTQIVRAQGPLALAEFASKYSHLVDENEIQPIITQMCDSLYTVAKKLNTEEGWIQYQKFVPKNEYRDSEKYKELTDKKWNTEPAAWKTVQSLRDVEACNRYIKQYPKGQHRANVDKMIIDLEVEKVFSSDHGTLPAMDKKNSSHGKVSTIKIYNNTEYTINLMYSGDDSKRISLSPKQKKSITLKNGTYKVVASTPQGGVRSFAGTEYLEGGLYEVEYYISNRFQYRY